MFQRRSSVLLLCSLLVIPLLSFKSSQIVLDNTYIVMVDASTKEERTAIASLGISIEEVREKYIVGVAHQGAVEKLKENGFHFSFRPLPAFLLDFPTQDSAYHNVEELEEELIEISQAYPDITSLSVIGKSVEGRNLYMMKISMKQSRISEKPGVIFLGTHHAREHISTEVPLYLIKHLVENYGKDESVTKLIKEREIWVMPLVNPDGVAFDIGADKPYKFWRKNRQSKDADYVYGVDLNRNYGFKWGCCGGSSGDQRSDTYRGQEAFSEPETQAIKTFIEAHKNITILLTYHNYSELILYPWGYKYDSIERREDLKVHETMAQTMAQMTGYHPQQSSDLYLVEGDTTDWAFGEHGIISFTIELSPANRGFTWGFYLPASQIPSVVKVNIPAALYLMEYADNPYRVLSELRLGPNHFFDVPLLWPSRIGH